MSNAILERFKELGYTEDIYGKELANKDQILELKPHDVLLPSAFESPDEKADDVFMKVTKFISSPVARKLPYFSS